MQAYWLVVRVLLTPPAEAAASQKWKIIYLQVLSCERWLICRNEDASKKIFMAAGILVFDFELFIGGRYDLLHHT